MFRSFLFAVDNESKRTVYFTDNTKLEIPFEQIISVEVIEDNEIILSKSSMRTIGGALVGGAIAGGVGAIVGGLSGDTKQQKKVSKVQVKIKVRDITKPSLIIDVFNCKSMLTDGKPIDTTTSRGEGIYKLAMKTSSEIADTLSVFIDENDHAEQTTPNVTNAPSPQQSSDSIADELLKLANLRNKGILTDEEFNLLKQKLLGM